MRTRKKPCDHTTPVLKTSVLVHAGPADRTKSPLFLCLGCGSSDPKHCEGKPVLETDEANFMANRGVMRMSPEEQVHHVVVNGHIVDLR